MMPHAAEWERNGDVPGMTSITRQPLDHRLTCSGDLYAKFAAANFLIPNLPAPLPVKWLKKLGIYELPGGLKVEDFDYMHALIYIDEVHFCTLLLSLLY